MNTPATQHDTEAMLDAGAVLPVGSAVARDDTADTLTARSYRHPVLGDRVVVRLVPGKLGRAEDLSAGFLSFEEPERVEEVGVVRQQALGFPAWALVHDPDNGHHALALVKEIERLSRLARTRIGPANDGFVALGDQLARAVPHFLPSYYEEVARAFLAADNPTYASRMFTKARDAERSYGLAVDAERQHAVFLEFALAGALTAKALSAHSRDLAVRCAPQEAFERFRRLCVERTLGGLPPYAGMHTDLRRLAKAAGIDQVTGDGRVLVDLMGAPAVLRAPEGFWTAYRGAFGPLCAHAPAVRGQLLAMLPDNVTDEVWLAILIESGATAALTAPAGVVPDAEAPADGPAGWLDRFAVHRYRSGRTPQRQPELVALVEAMVPRLVADGQPVTLFDRRTNIDLDLLDVCLAGGAPVADPKDVYRLPVTTWQAGDDDGRRDLAAAAADPRFLPLLANGVEVALGDGHDAGKVAAVVAVPGLRAALHHWLETMAGIVARHGLPTVGEQLRRVIRAASPAGFAVNPQAVGRIVGHDLGAVLGRTLRAGVLDEYGWPALEEAAAQIAAEAAAQPDASDDDRVVELVNQWPLLLARRADLVLAVGPDRIEATHREPLLRKQPGQWWTARLLRHADDQLLIGRTHNYELACYWTGDPTQGFVLGRSADSADWSLPLPDGGRTFGGKPLHAGDQTIDQRGHVISDGSRYWRLFARGNRGDRWVEFDPTTGDLIGAAPTDEETGPQPAEDLPAFLAEGVLAGEELNLRGCQLRPAGGAPVDGPFGQHDGLVGWRLQEQTGRETVGTRVDGRSFTIRRDSGARGSLRAVLRFPGADTTYGVFATGNDSLVYDADGFAIGAYQEGMRQQRYAAGAALLPPLAFWPHLRPRDPDGSAALRAVTDEQATALLHAAAGLDLDALRALVAERLPQLTHPALLDGVTGVLRCAARHAEHLADLGRVLAGQVVYPKPKAGAKAPTHVPDEVPAGSPLAAATDQLLYGTLHRFLPYCSCTGHRGIQMIQDAATALAGPQLPPADRLQHHGDGDFYRVFGLLPAAMLLAALPDRVPEAREALLALLETVDASGLTAVPGAKLRRVELESGDKHGYRRGSVFTSDGRRLYVCDVRKRSATALEYAPDGVFGPVDGFRIIGEEQWSLPTGLGRLVRLVRERGPVSWGPQLADTLAAAAGMSRAEAVLLLAGLPAEPSGAQLGMSAALIQVAAEAWHGCGASPVRLLGMLLPDDPETLWTDGPRTDLVIEFRIGRHGRRTPVDDALLEQAQRAELCGGSQVAELLHGLANPDMCPWLATGAAATSGSPDRSGATTASQEHAAEAMRQELKAVNALPWLVYHLPPSHPMLALLPVVYQRLRERAMAPGRLVYAGYTYDSEYIDRIVVALGGEPSSGGKRTQVGPLVVDDKGRHRAVWVSPRLLSGPEDPALDMVAGCDLYQPDDPGFRGLRMLLAGSLTVPPAGDADLHDPAQALPELVAEAAGKLGIGADAATLYLQLLALPDPTDRNVARWTGWKPARLKAARAELVATDLVVAAKRSRAGRSLFLPGGWLALRSPHLPVERWKVPLLTVDADGGVEQGSVLPTAGVPAVFELAWQRVSDGDTPRFDELNTTERRR